MRPSATVSSDLTIEKSLSDQELASNESETPIPAEIDLWQRLRARMALGELDTPLVTDFESRLTRHPAMMTNALLRARLYLYHIVEEVEARGMPGEIALLPLIESAFDPRAQSPANASGIWQFIPSTGRVYGLKQNGWYDGRRDVVTATDAALDYLERLQDMFGDWKLALAAYNCGEGCVTRAIRRNRLQGLPTDYQSLSLPAETRNYVPRLLAARNVIVAPEQYGIRLVDLPNKPYFKQVSLPYPVEARNAARLAGIDVNELMDLNPGFRRHVIHAESQDSLLLPVDRVETFLGNLNTEQSQRLRMRTYTANKGELLSRIAERYDVTVQWLKDHNPLDVKRGKISQAQTLMLPPAKGQVARNATAVTQPARKTAAPARTHTVRKGDTLFALAKRYNVSVADIRERNGSLRVLKPGTKLHIPVDS